MTASGVSSIIRSIPVNVFANDEERSVVAHLVPRARTDQPQRGRRTHVPHLRDEGPRLLHAGVRGSSRRWAGTDPDQPGLAVRGRTTASVALGGSQPDCYVLFLDGSTRLLPAWTSARSGRYTIPRHVLADAWCCPAACPTLPPSIRSSRPGCARTPGAPPAAAAPRRTGPDRARRHGPSRFYMVLLISGGNDHRAEVRHQPQRDDLAGGRRWSSLPPIAYYVDRTASASACSSTTGRSWPTAWRPASSSACPTASSSRCISRSGRSTTTARPPRVRGRPRSRRR